MRPIDFFSAALQSLGEHAGKLYTSKARGERSLAQAIEYPMEKYSGTVFALVGGHNKIKQEHALMRTSNLLGIAVGAFLVASSAAQAGVIVRTFTGSGSTGYLGSSYSEPWAYGGSPPGSSDVSWGSPGASEGLAVLQESGPVGSFEITFAGATIDPTQLASSADGCQGGLTGGTVFCGPVPGSYFAMQQWTAALTGSNSILFSAPSAGADLMPGETYFVNIFLDSGGSDSAFTGYWGASSASVPEPSGLALLGGGLLALGFSLRRRRRA